MMDVDHLVQHIRQLPVRDRLRLVERVVHDIANVSPAEGPPADPFPIGLFADDPDSVDDMMKTVVEMRRSSRLRDVGGAKSGLAAIVGQWPGDETDEQVVAAPAELA